MQWRLLLFSEMQISGRVVCNLAKKSFDHVFTRRNTGKSTALRYQVRFNSLQRVAKVYRMLD